MVDEGEQDLAQVELARPPLVDPEQDYSIALLHLGELVQLVEHDARLGVALELDHDPHSVAVRLIAQIADSVEALVVDQFGHPLDQPRLVHLVGNLAHDNRRAARALVGLNSGQRAHQQRSASCKVGLPDRLTPEQLSAGGKVGPGNDVEDFLQGQRRILD